MAVLLDKTMTRREITGALYAVSRQVYVLAKNGSLTRHLAPGWTLASETKVQGFTDEALTVSAGTGPFSADADGQFSVWFPEGNYDLYMPGDASGPMTRWQPLGGTTGVTSVAGKTGAVSLVAADVPALDSRTLALEGGQVTQDSRIAVVQEAPLNVKDARFGALGNDSADDTAAFTAWGNLLLSAANGAEGIIPPGGYRMSAFPSLNAKRSVTIRAAGGRSGGASEATRLIKTGGGSGSFISAQSSFGIVIEDVAILHDTGFTGTLVDFSNPSGFDTAYGTLRNVTLSKTAAAARGATGLSLVKAISSNFDAVVFRDLNIGVRGRSVTADYSNIMNFRGCTWLGIVTAPVINIGSNWGFDNATVQQLVNDNACFIKREPGFFSNGGYVHGAWMGDTIPSSVGNWIEWAGNGFSIMGNTFGYCAIGVKAEDTTTAIGSRGLVIMGNQLPPSNVAVHLVGALGVHRGHAIMGNNWPGGVLTMDNMPYYSFLMGPTGLAGPLDFMEMAAAPALPVGNGSRLYTDDNGAGKTRLRWRTDSADNGIFTSA